MDFEMSDIDIWPDLGAPLGEVGQGGQNAVWADFRLDLEVDLRHVTSM
jgi:hypothetical protein